MSIYIIRVHPPLYDSNDPCLDRSQVRVHRGYLRTGVMSHTRATLVTLVSKIASCSLGLVTHLNQLSCDIASKPSPASDTSVSIPSLQNSLDRDGRRFEGNVSEAENAIWQLLVAFRCFFQFQVSTWYAPLGAYLRESMEFAH